ncbi:MAG: hypothetical protein ACLQBB_09825 [Solirubrobacteraceae bacterium]
MGIRLITGPANAGKARELMGAMRRHLAHHEEPLLIVPTRADVEFYLRELAGEQAAMGARVQRFEELIEELVARAGVSEPALGGLARARLIATLDRGAGSGRRPGFLRALGELTQSCRLGACRPRDSPRGSRRRWATASRSSASISRGCSGSTAAGSSGLGGSMRSSAPSGRSTGCAGDRRCGGGRRCCSTASTT